QYAGIVEEHRAVRGAVGLFDVSHMGEFEVAGPHARVVLQSLTTNDVAALAVGQVQYSVLCYPNGTIVDDLTVYRLADDRFMLTVNAANIDKDWAHVTQYTEHGKDARWTNVSADTGLIAVQGPRAEALVGRLADQDVTKIGYYRFARGRVGGVPALVSRTGYTGEDGFARYAKAADTGRLWPALRGAGSGRSRRARTARPGTSRAPWRTSRRRSPSWARSSRSRSAERRRPRASSRRRSILHE